VSGLAGALQERIGVGDIITTRRNDRTLGVANRQTWTVTALSADGGLTIAPQSAVRGASSGGTLAGTASDIRGTPGGAHRGRRVKSQVSTGGRTLPGDYARSHVELAYARTVYGAQGETVHAAHFVVGEQTGAAGAYVAMTRGRDHNTAHMVAESVDEAREQWVEVFARDRADLGPGHAAERAVEDLERYGSLDWETAEALAITKSTSTGHGTRHDPEVARHGQVRQSPSR
jgi:exodeoxyribonuclease V alpha subunit